MILVYRKRFYSSVPAIIVPPVLVFLFNGTLIVLFGMEALQKHKVDNVIHGLGGASVCLTLAGLLWHLGHRQIISMQDGKIFYILVLGLLCFTIISWEVLEYMVFYPHELLTYDDTISDMVFGFLGGLLITILLPAPLDKVDGL